MRNLLVSHLLIAAVVSLTTLELAAQTRPRRVSAPPASFSTRAATSAVHNAEVAAAPADSEMIHLDGELVEVPVVVSDRSGRYVPRLTKESFRIFEDGRQQEISFFAPQRVPFHVAILMDTSISTFESLPEIQRAAIGLIRQLGPEDRALLIAFSDSCTVLQEFTNDKDRLSHAVLSTYSDGKTRLYDSVFATVTQRLQAVQGRKAMIILSDGQDTASSQATFEDAVGVCRETDVVVYGVRYPETMISASSYVAMRQSGRFPLPRHSQSIPVPNPSSPGLWQTRSAAGQPDRDPFMEAITHNSGGVIYYADSVADVHGLCARIAEELRHVYTIGYQPRNRMKNGGYRQISVDVPALPNAAVRHRMGYVP